MFIYLKEDNARELLDTGRTTIRLGKTKKAAVFGKDGWPYEKVGGEYIKIYPYFGRKGDVLLAKEPWFDGPIYKADDKTVRVKWKSAISMPTRFVRLKVEVVDLSFTDMWTAELKSIPKECPSSVGGAYG